MSEVYYEEDMRVLLLSGVWQHALQLRGRRWEGATSQARAMRNYTQQEEAPAASTWSRQTIKTFKYGKEKEK
jgi:hypothetical protein